MHSESNLKRAISSSKLFASLTAVKLLVKIAWVDLKLNEIVIV